MSTRRLQTLIATFAVFAFVCPQPAWAQEYEVTDLAASGLTNQPWSLNALGQVAGYSGFSDGHDEGFFYDGTTIDYIGSPGPTSRSDLVGINDLGEAVGKSGTVYENGEALLRKVNGSVRRLGTLGGSRSAAYSINNSSQVVGWSKLADDFGSRAFLWEDGSMEPLPVLGGTQATAEWINDAGQIVGSSTTDTGGLQQFAVIWENGAVTQLPPIHEGQSNLARYIHNDGSIAGRVTLPGPDGFVRRAAVWRGGEVDLVLGTLADNTPESPFASSVANAVNAHGVVVGMSVNAAGAYVPFVYRNGTMYQLDDLMPDPWIASYVGSGSLNDLGQIVVKATRPGEPGSYALLLTPLSTTVVADGLDAGEGIDDAGYSLATHGRRITYRIARSEPVTVSLFDVHGRLVARLVDEGRPAGEHAVVWNGRTATGRRTASGVYFVRMTTPRVAVSSRITLLR